MKNKWIGLLQDKEFRFRIFILGVIALLAVWQLCSLYGQKKQISTIKKENERKHALWLAKKMGDSEITPESQTVYRLEGTTIQDGSFQALINGVIYKVGDMIDQYKITDITMQSSTLQNPSTLEIRKLALYQN